MDLEAYLESKGLRVRHAGDQVHVPCVFCGEDPQSRGRLYINNGPVDDSVGLYDCKLCGARGNIRTLKRHFGDEVDDNTDTNFDQHRVLQDAAAFYVANLHPKVGEWLAKERSLTAETIRDQKFGWAPSEDKTALFRHLRSKGYDAKVILATGLCVERGGNVRDFFQGQVTIPYLVNGSVVMIRGKEIGGKYMTPPNQKTRLYNVDALTGAEEVVITEGEFDALVLSQMGYAAVASPGSNVWQEAWNRSFGDARIIYVVFDPDEAGKTGAQKVRDQLGARVKLVQLPIPTGVDAKDVDPSAMVADGADRPVFDDLMRAALMANSLLVTVDEAFEEWSAVQGLDGLKLGFEELDTAIRPGLLPGQVCIVLAKTNTGKAQPLDEPVLTPWGWTTMGEVKPGSFVVGSDGKSTQVEGVFPQGERPTMEVVLSDGEVVRCDPEHLWTWSTRSSTRIRTTTTSDMATALASGKRVYLPMPDPIEGRTASLLVEPYLLGVLLGDGCLRNVVNVTTDDEIVRALDLPEGVSAKRYAEAGPGVGEYRLSGPQGLPNPLTGALRRLGLMGLYSYEKHIPDVYLRAHWVDRLALLQGLLDTDGSVDRGGSIEYSTSSPALARSVKDLVLSLGGSCGRGIRERITASGRPGYRMSLRLPREMSPFRLYKKMERMGVRKPPMRSVVEVRTGPILPCQCIKVAAPDSLYVTSGYALTHNTIILLNMFQRIRMAQPDAHILFVSLEQTRGDWFERARRIWNFYNLDARRADVNERTLEYWRPNLELVDKNRISEAELVSCIREYEMRHGRKPDVVAVDYLGYWAAGFKERDRYAKVTEAVLSLKAVAKDERVAIVSPHQVSRTADFGAEFEMDSARDSGAVEETADFVFGIWNPDTMKGVALEDRSGVVNLKIAKSRHGGKGNQIKLQFAPLTLVMAPVEDPRFVRFAREELKYQLQRDTWETAIFRHRTGIQDIDIEHMLEAS